MRVRPFLNAQFVTNEIFSISTFQRLPGDCDIPFYNCHPTTVVIHTHITHYSYSLYIHRASSQKLFKVQYMPTILCGRGLNSQTEPYYSGAPQGREYSAFLKYPDEKTLLKEQQHHCTRQERLHCPNRTNT